MCGYPFFLFLKHSFNEVLKLCPPLALKILPFLESKVDLAYLNVVLHFFLGISFEWESPCQHEEEHDAKGPNITLDAITALVDLWSHVIKGALAFGEELIFIT